MTAQARPTFSNDGVFFWTRIAELIFVLAVPGLYIIDEWTGVRDGLVQLAVLLVLTTWLRRRRLRKWERREGTA